MRGFIKRWLGILLQRAVIKEWKAQTKAQFKRHREGRSRDKVYVSHVSLMSTEMSEAEYWRALAREDDRDKRRALEAKHKRSVKVEFICPGSMRDEVLVVEVRNVLAENPGYRLVRASIPAADGFVTSPSTRAYGGVN